jgi:hypothetical protein
MKRITLICLALVLAAVVLAGCAHPLDVSSLTPDPPYGFWSGLWHGIIAPISFFVSLFTNDIAMYAKNNNGGWYDFGFCLGAGILFGSGCASSHRT